MLYEHQPHPHIAARAMKNPAQSSDEAVGFNGRLAVAITKAVGTMQAVYVAIVIQVTWMILASLGIWLFAQDHYPFPFLLFLSNIIQLLLMFVILVGQQVLGKAADKRAINTYTDTEAIIHSCIGLEMHQQAQDRVLIALAEKLEISIEQISPVIVEMADAPVSEVPKEV